MRVLLYKCSLSLGRVVRGSKLMHLDLIHGLFITLTEFRLSTIFIPIIIMHIYNWYHSITTSIHLYTQIQITVHVTHSPLLYRLSFLIPLAPLFDPLSLTWNPPCCDRIRPHWSPIACKLNSPILSPCSYTPSSKFPTPGVSPFQIYIH
jgi:hypothetical protein